MPQRYADEIVQIGGVSTQAQPWATNGSFIADLPVVNGFQGRRRPASKFGWASVACHAAPSISTAASVHRRVSLPRSSISTRTAGEPGKRSVLERAQADGVAVGGEGGLLQQLTKIVLESSLEGELDAHLGYGKHDPAGRDGGNSRNGTRAKTVLIDTGPVQIEVPRASLSTRRCRDTAPG